MYISTHRSGRLYLTELYLHSDISNTMNTSRILALRSFYCIQFIVALIASASLLVSCLPEDALKTSFASYRPAAMNDGWAISTPSAEAIDSTTLSEIYRQFHSDATLWQVRSLLVFRNGNLVAESYTKDPADATTPRAVWSCTKQVVSLLTGIAIDKKLITLQDSISKFLPEASNHADKRGITLRHLLTMRSGIDFQNGGLSGQTQALLRQIPDNSVEFILARPLEAAPGQKFRYTDGSPHLVSAMLQRATGKPLRDWAREVLFSKLSISRLNWTEYRDGVTLGGFGILSTPRELAKFGQLVLNGGKWRGEQLVSKQWIEEMTTETSDVAGYSAQFGYCWWLYKSRSLWAMDGHGGQYVFVAPKKNMVIVMTAEVNTQDDFQFLNTEALRWVDKILNAAQ